MRTFKRNAVILTVVLFVCVAAYLNWSYNKDSTSDTPDSDVISATDSAVEQEASAGGNGESAATPDAGLYYTPDADSAASAEYFAATRLNRQQARDEAAETLVAVSTAEGASQEIIDSALDKITALAAASQKEAELESMIMAKGFSDCVVFLSDDGVKVTVPAPLEGLSQTQVAQITDIILSETEYTAADLKVIPFTK